MVGGLPAPVASDVFIKRRKDCAGCWDSSDIRYKLCLSHKEHILEDRSFPINFAYK